VKKVVHVACGGQIGWVPDSVGPGTKMRAEDFTHLDGTKPVAGTPMDEKCPQCGSWIMSAIQMTLREEEWPH